MFGVTKWTAGLKKLPYVWYEPWGNTTCSFTRLNTIMPTPWQQLFVFLTISGNSAATMFKPYAEQWIIHPFLQPSTIRPLFPPAWMTNRADSQVLQNVSFPERHSLTHSPNKLHTPSTVPLTLSLFPYTSQKWLSKGGIMTYCGSGCCAAILSLAPSMSTGRSRRESNIPL